MSEESPSALDGGAVTDRARLEAAVAARQAELAGIDRASAPREWALLQIRLGEALQELSRTYQYESWSEIYQVLNPQARVAFESALEELSQLAPHERAAARMHLAELLGYSSEWERAIGLCQEAIGEVSREAPELWGKAHRHLAEALLVAERNAGHEPPRPAPVLLQRAERAVEASRAAVTTIRAPAALAEANETLLKALIAVGNRGGDASLLDEAIAIGRAITAQLHPQAPTTEIVAAYASLGNALLARARGSKSESAYHRAAIVAHRTALAVVHARTRRLHMQFRFPLGTALLLLAQSRSEAIADVLAQDRQRVEADGNAADRLTWAVDVLAVIEVQQSRNVVIATELLTALKTFADRHQETPLWEAWAMGVQGVCKSLKDERADRLLRELRACIDAHGTADMRLAWANGASSYFGLLLKRDLPATAPVLDDLKAYAAASSDPTLWSIWGRAVCQRVAQRRYSEAHLDRARAELAETKPHVWSRSYHGWPQAAAVIHEMLLTKDPLAAGPLRAEIRASAEITREDTAWRAWMTATVTTIKEIRWTDYAAARALLAELDSPANSGTGYNRKRALADARALMQDQEVKLAHGIIDEVLKPLDIAPQATATGNNLRISRLDASKAPSLETVGSGIYCREMILTGTAIEELPDDLQVTQRLDVSQCQRLKRLPAGLKVGQLSARECPALEALPAGLEVSYLDLTGCSALEALPADLVIRRGRLSLRGCERLTALPTGLGPIAQLDLSGCLNITALPSDLVVTAWIDIGGSGLTALPPGLEGIGIRWRGVPVDERIAFRPETLDVGEILAETNAERRRVMMERFGLDRFMNMADAQVLDDDQDAGGRRRLLRIDLADDEPLVCVSVICPSTSHQFMLRVPPTMTTCRQAVAWTAGFDDPDDYQPAAET